MFAPEQSLHRAGQGPRGDMPVRSSIIPMDSRTRRAPERGGFTRPFADARDVRNARARRRQDSAATPVFTGWVTEGAERHAHFCSSAPSCTVRGGARAPPNHAPHALEYCSARAPDASLPLLHLPRHRVLFTCKTQRKSNVKTCKQTN